MVKSIEINQLIELGGNCYYIISIYFTKRRIMCQFAALASHFYPEGSIKQEEMMIQQWKSSDRKIDPYALYINGSIHKWQEGFMKCLSQQEKEHVFRKEIPKCFADQELVLIEEEFEPLDSDQEIKQIKFVKKTQERTILIQKEIRLPIGKIHTPYELEYEDTQDKIMRKLTVHQLYSVDISNLPNLKKKGKLSKGIPLIAQIEVEDDIEKANMFIKEYSIIDEAESISLKQIEAASLRENGKEGFQYRNHFLGMVNDKDKEVDIVIFSCDIKERVEKKVVVYDHWIQPYVK